MLLGSQSNRVIVKDEAGVSGVFVQDKETGRDNKDYFSSKRREEHVDKGAQLRYAF